MKSDPHNLISLMQIDYARGKSTEIKEQAKKAWAEFCERFPSERDCAKDLADLLTKRGLLACYCFTDDSNSSQFRFEDDYRLAICLKCENSYRTTAGTFFDRRRKLRPWYAAMWFMENGVFISSNWFGKIVRVAQATALNIYHLLMYSVDLEYNPESENVWSREFLPHFIKRSIWSIRGLHPSSEESEQEQESNQKEKKESAPFDMKDSDIFEKTQQEPISDSSDADEFTRTDNSSNLTFHNEPEHQLILDCLRQAGALHPDELSTRTELEIAKLNERLTDLELSGLIKMTFGGRFELTSREPRSAPKEGNHCVDELDSYQIEMESELITREPGNAKKHKSVLRKEFDRLIRREFQGISRKYLQLYLSIAKLLSFSTVRSERSIIDACLKTGDLETKKLKLYQTPKILCFPLNAEARN